MAAVLVAALLASSCPAWASETGEVGQTSKMQYVVRGVFVLTLALIVGVGLYAVLSKSDDTARLAPATAKLDRALGLTSVTPATRAVGHDVALLLSRWWLPSGSVAAAPAARPDRP